MKAGIKALVGVAAAALAMGVVAGPAVAAEPNPARPAPTVDRPTPAQVRADVVPGEEVTVAAAFAEPDGTMRIDSMEVVGPEQAVEAVEEFAAQERVVATGVSAETVAFAGGDPYRLPFPGFKGQYASDMLCIDPLSTRVGNPYGTCDKHMWQTTAGSGQVIAIVDTGMKTDHPEFASLLVTGARCMGGQPCQAVASTAPSDVGAHGTAVASVSNAVTDNGIGLAGVARDAKIMPVQVFAPNNSGTGADMARGIIWAADNGATVINVSGGVAGVDDPVLKAAAAHAIGKNVAVVAAAGNFGKTSKIVYPAAYPGVIGVGAINELEQIWADGDDRGSSWGSWVDVVVPGKEVPGINLDLLSDTVGIEAAFGTWTGTSVASPITAGIVAAIRKHAPSLTPSQLELLLQTTAERLGGTAGRNDTFGWGLVQPQRALDATAQYQPPGPPTALSVAPGDASATVGFTPPKLEQGVPPVVKYQYATKTGASFGAWTDVHDGRTASPVTISGLTNGQATTIKLRSVNVNGAGAESATVTTTPAVPVKTQFTPIDPVRVFDSRWAETPGIDTGELSSGIDPSGRKVSVKDGRSSTGVVPGKANVVPAGATAVAFNITVVGQTASGFASVAPGSVTTAPGASTINWTSASQTMANGFVTGIDANRDIRVFVGSRGTTHAIIDIVGYYSPVAPVSAPASATETMAASQSVFVPISPTRVYNSILDKELGPLQNSKADYKARVVQVAKAIDPATGLPTGDDKVPAGATGIAYNVTITGTKGSGYLAIAPGDKLGTAPSVSVINWSGSQTQANATIVGIGPNTAVAGHSIGVFPAPADNGGETHFIVDVVGYFIPKAQDTTGKGAQFVAMPPLRAYSSLSETPLEGGTSRVTSVGLDKGVPVGASAVAFNLTITGSDLSGYLSVAPGDTATAPATSTINWSGSNTKANGSMVGVDGSRQVKTFAGGRGKTHYLLDIAGYYVP